MLGVNVSAFWSAVRISGALMTPIAFYAFDRWRAVEYTAIAGELHTRAAAVKRQLAAMGG